MMFYTSVEKGAPNPRRVELFLKEKGIDLPTTAFTLFKREHKSEAFLAKHPLGKIPALELDDGTLLSESVAICRYLEALYPERPLFGRTPVEVAQIEIWSRRVELMLMTPLGLFWLHAHPLTSKLHTQFTEFGESNRARASDVMRWFESQIGDGWLAGGYSITDILLQTSVEFGSFIGIPIPDDCPKLKAWLGRAQAREAAA